MQGGGGSTPVPFLSPNLPDSQITQKWTFDTTIWVASPIYAFLSVIRQQMSPFDPFRGGGRQKGTMSPFLTVFFTRASLNTKTWVASSLQCPAHEPTWVLRNAHPTIFKRILSAEERLICFCLHSLAQSDATPTHTSPLHRGLKGPIMQSLPH